MKSSNILVTLLLGSLIVFSGCGMSDKEYTYSVKLTNITAGQPMSPIIVSSSSLFTIGSAASIALEKMAEGGDNKALLTGSAVSGSSLLLPSKSETVMLLTKNKIISVAAMLVKTNDAFTGIDSYDVSALNINESKNLYLNVYDAGTEDNSETNATVPGLEGEGYNSSRSSSNIVTLHSGIIGNEDGLASSGLTSFEKFNNPAALLVITRIK